MIVAVHKFNQTFEIVADFVFRGYKSKKIENVAYLLNGVEIWVVEVTKEPEDARSENLAEEKYERCKIEDIDHSDQPVDEHRSARRNSKAVLTIFQRGIEHALQEHR